MLDITFCADFEVGKCPEDCFYAQKIRELQAVDEGRHQLVVSFAHAEALTDDCRKGGE